MRIDVHVHISAFTPAHGSMSSHLRNRALTRFLRLRFGIFGDDEKSERAFERKLANTIQETAELDAAVVLAFDQIYDESGKVDPKTHLYVANDYVIELCKRHPKMLFGASIHPYRKDAVAELERCVAAGAVLVKWLPIVQGFDPSHKLCQPFFEALAHHKIPLLSHTSGERALPIVAPQYESPELLLPALKAGVRVIAAHCGSPATNSAKGYLDEFIRMALDHEQFFGDTSALNIPPRWNVYPALLENPRIRAKLVHGSDWPIISLPPPNQLKWSTIPRIMLDPNWMRRDITIKKQLGFDDAYFHRAATLLRMPE
jgi:predicted TIM-barrel fold metal-dependent hydrolase